MCSEGGTGQGLQARVWRRSALCRWAEQSLGQQLVTEPTHEELHYSEKRLRALEKKCQDLQQRTQRRLAVSAALRATASPNAAGSRPASAGVGQTLADGASAGIDAHTISRQHCYIHTRTHTSLSVRGTRAARSE